MGSIKELFGVLRDVTTLQKSPGYACAIGWSRAIELQRQDLTEFLSLQGLGLMCWALMSALGSGRCPG